MPPHRICTATTVKGYPCKSFAMPDIDFCIAHSPDPEHRRLHRAGAKVGGHAKSTAIRTAKEWQELSQDLKLEDIPGLLIGAGLAVLSGEVDPARLSAFAGAVRAAATVAEVALLEQRIHELERFLADE